MNKITIYVLLACLWTVSAVQAQSFGSPAMRKLQMAEFAISNFYVDKVDEDKLVEEAIIKMLAQLDPHSTYSDAEEVKKMNEPLQGNFEGIGVQFQMIEDTLLVVQPVSNGPSEKIGILAGDRIIAVNDSAIAGVKMSTEEIMKRLRGPKGSKVNLKIVRRGVQDPLVFTVKRDKIPILSLDASYMIQPKTGYIRINRFGATTAEEFKKAMKELQKQGMKDMILDLQGNGGGYLNAAIDLANEFLGQKELIVYTEGRTAKRSDFYAKGNGDFRNGRLIILVDEYTASASEIVSGAVQDWDRGIIVGRRSFGKGLVQRPIDLPDGSMIRLTIARYYTPSGRSIQKPYDSTVDYNKDLIERFNHGELMNADSIHFPDSLKVQTKKLGRTVYGGGGIMPDIFIPRDTSGVTSYFSNVINSGVLYLYTLEYSDRHRDQFSKFDNWEELYKYLQSQPLLEDFTNFAATKGIKKRPTLIRISGSLIENQIQAYIVRNFFDEAGFYPIFLKDDVTMLKAIEILKEGKSFPLQNTQQVTNGNLRSEAGLTKRYGLAKEIIFEDYIVRAIG